MSEEKVVALPIFYTCSRCKRNIVSGSTLWADFDKRVCVCCECFGVKENETIDLYQCKRERCKLHKYRDHDYITDSVEMNQTVERAVVIEPQDEYDEKSNKCYCCDRELTMEYFYVNSKFSFFNNGKFEDPESKAKLKAKICRDCFDRVFDKLRLDFI